jgi:hypothetical protein
MGRERSAHAGHRIAAALMLHPSRRDNVQQIMQSCAPIPIDVVMDPDPGGPPSSLRTARIAWSATRDDVTHHLVLQDDVVLAEGFAWHLNDIVARWPRHAIALYVNWNSPYNSYRVRCAAAAGRPWAPIASWEWIPTLGLVLPVTHARALAEYLETLPDTCTKDDYAITWFCAAMKIPVFTVVPHLLEHGDIRSVVGNEHQGARHATVTAELSSLDAGYWRRADIPYDHMHTRQGAVSVIRSLCYVRYWRLDGGPSLNRTLPDWSHWSERCELLGVPRDRILATFADRLGASARTLGRNGRPEVALEFWAAGFLLGADVGQRAGHPSRPLSRAAEAVRDQSIRTWVLSGLDADDRRILGPEGQQRLVELCAEAVEQGRDYALMNSGRMLPVDACITPEARVPQQP